MAELSLAGCRILVVEDEYYLAAEFANELSDAGATVLGPVGTIEDALELIDAEATFDGAVVDINLRGDKVFPVADRLFARDVPFVFVTGYDQSAIPARYQDVPRCEKPIDVKKVAEAIGQERKRRGQAA